jgi:hypothetical protein
MHKLATRNFHGGPPLGIKAIAIAVRQKGAAAAAFYGDLCAPVRFDTAARRRLPGLRCVQDSGRSGTSAPAEFKAWLVVHELANFDELVAWPGRGRDIALGRVIHEIKSGWAPPSLHVDLRRAQGCEPPVYTMADIDRFAAMSEFKAWLVAHELM